MDKIKKINRRRLEVGGNTIKNNLEVDGPRDHCGAAESRYALESAQAPQDKLEQLREGWVDLKGAAAALKQSPENQGNLGAVEATAS